MSARDRRIAGMQRLGLSHLQSVIVDKHVQEAVEIAVEAGVAHLKDLPEDMRVIAVSGFLGALAGDILAMRDEMAAMLGRGTVQ